MSATLAKRHDRRRRFKLPKTTVPLVMLWLWVVTDPVGFRLRVENVRYSTPLAAEHCWTVAHQAQIHAATFTECWHSLMWVAS